MADYADLLPALESIAREAGRIAQDGRPTAERELKPDGSIVTSADREVESYLRPELESLVPGSAVWGEEYGFAEEGPGGLWLVDPIYGTTNYAVGTPHRGVSIGLALGDSIVAGALFLPDLDELYLASLGGGATCNGQALAAIPPGPVQSIETVGYSETVSRAHPDVRWPGKMRCSGSFVVEGAFVAQQRYRGLVGISEKLYDVAAAVLIGGELGADIRYADGRPFEVEPLKDGRKIERAWLIYPSCSRFMLADAGAR